MTAQHYYTVTTPTSRDYVAVTKHPIIQSTWKGYLLAHYTFRSMITKLPSNQLARDQEKLKEIRKHTYCNDLELRES